MPPQEIKGKEKYKINIGHKGLTEDEIGFIVKFKESKKKRKFTLSLGKNGLRLLEKDSEEEIGRWNYKDVKNFSYNSTFDYFEFSTTTNNINVDTYTFKTKQCSEMFDQVKLLLAENLKKHNIDNPDQLIKAATHQIDHDHSHKRVGISTEVNDDHDRHDHNEGHLTELIHKQQKEQKKKEKVQEGEDEDPEKKKKEDSLTVPKKKGRKRSHSTSESTLGEIKEELNSIQNENNQLKSEKQDTDELKIKRKTSGTKPKPNPFTTGESVPPLIVTPFDGLQNPFTTVESKKEVKDDIEVSSPKSKRKPSKKKDLRVNI